MLQKIWLIALVSLTLLSCHQQSHKESWSEGMQGMTAALRDLLPYIYDDKRFAHPRNKTFIQTRLTELNHHSAFLDSHIAQGLSGNDPLMKVGLEGLKRNIEKSADSFLVDNHAYSQQLLQSSVSYCVKCHMRTNVGRSFLVYESFGQGAFQNIKSIDLARAQIAMREFGKARQTLIETLLNKKESASERRKALEVLMTLNIRFENNFQQAVEDFKIVKSDQSIFQNQAIPKAWFEYLIRWSHKKADTELSLEKALKDLKTQTPKENTFVRDLHISRVFHKELSSQDKPAMRARILEALGLIYQAHTSLSSWELPDRYFEACISDYPHSQQAKRCYYTLEKAVLDSHKIAQLEALPTKEKIYLMRYKALAESNAPKGQSIQEHPRF